MVGLEVMIKEIDPQETQASKVLAELIEKLPKPSASAASFRWTGALWASIILFGFSQEATLSSGIAVAVCIVGMWVKWKGRNLSLPEHTFQHLVWEKARGDAHLMSCTEDGLTAVIDELRKREKQERLAHSAFIAARDAKVIFKLFRQIDSNLPGDKWMPSVQLTYLEQLAYKMQLLEPDRAIAVRRTEAQFTSAIRQADRAEIGDHLRPSIERARRTLKEDIEKRVHHYSPKLIVLMKEAGERGIADATLKTSSLDANLEDIAWRRAWAKNWKIILEVSSNIFGLEREMERALNMAEFETRDGPGEGEALDSSYGVSASKMNEACDEIQSLFRRCQEG